MKTITYLILITTWIYFFPTIVSAQVKPDSYGIIFDDFDEINISYLWGDRQWTDEDGNNGSYEQFWYRNSWQNQSYASSSNVEIVSIGGEKHLQVGFDNNHTQAYGANNSPIVVSGFTSRTGTWAARIRFDKIQKGGTGSVTDSSMTFAFWTHSANVACSVDPASSNYSCPRDDAYWSEFNHEWNNFFQSSGETSAYQQLLSTGGVTNGLTGNALEDAFDMTNPLDPSPPAGGRDCFRYDGDETPPADYYNESPVNCMNWFVSDSDPDRYAILFFQYDGNVASYQAVAYDWGYDVDGALVYMDTTATIGTMAQPMQIKLSAIPFHTSDDEFNMYVDWVFYANDTSIDIWDVENNVLWLKNNNRTRVNTTGKDLDSSGSSGLTIEIETPLDLSGSVEEWLVVPSVQDENKILDVSWSFRTKATSLSSWSSWASGIDQGFSFTEEKIGDYYAIEVEVTVDDWLSSDTDTVCRQIVDFGAFEASCGVDPSPKRGNDSQITIDEFEVRTIIPEKYALIPSFPNPFNPATTIQYEMPEHGNIQLSIYSTTGELVKVLVDGYRDAGSHSVVWNAEGHASGVYIIRMIATNFTQSSQITLLK